MAGGPQLSNQVVPEGQRYEDTVPATLDLAERGRLATNALTSLLDPAFRYEQYFHVYIGADPPYMMHDTTGRPTNDPKYLESLPYMRLMCGSDLNAEAELGLMQGVVEDIGDDGLYYARNEPQRTWHEAAGAHVFKDGEQERRVGEDFANPAGNARLIIAMWMWYQRDGDPVWLERMAAMGRGLIGISIAKDDYAYYPESRVAEAFSYPRSGWKTTEEPTAQDVGSEVLDSNIFMYHGHPIRALSLLYVATGDRTFLDGARRLVNFVLKPKFWGVRDESIILQGAAHAHWTGHVPGHVSTLRALLEFALAAQDDRLMDFVRRGYEWGRHYLPMGLGYVSSVFKVRCGCSQPRLMALAIMLSDAGIGDYWEDVDRYIRNQATETQILSADALAEHVKYRPPHQLRPPQDSSDRVLERVVGGFLNYATPTMTHDQVKTGGCCNSNCSQGLYFAWDAVTRLTDGTATVNLLLNRASPWLDVHSHLPHEGKVMLRNKAARRLLVRTPLWVSKNTVQAQVNGQAAPWQWWGRSVFLSDLPEGAEVEIKFPLAERVEHHSAVESVDGQPQITEYRCVFRGNTLVDISPRSQGKGFPLYQRDHLRVDEAPMARVERFVSDKRIQWHG